MRHARTRAVSDDSGRSAARVGGQDRRQRNSAAVTQRVNLRPGGMETGRGTATLRPACSRAWHVTRRRRWCSELPLKPPRSTVLKEAGYRPASDGEPWDLWLWQSRSADRGSRAKTPTGGGLERRLATLQPPGPDAVVGAIPGGFALSNKRSLWIRLVKAYGRALHPRSVCGLRSDEQLVHRRRYG